MDPYREKDSDPAVLDGRRVIVLGYGNQGRPQALNLRDSGVDVGVAARRGERAWEKAAGDGFGPLDVEEGIESADILLMLLPDEVQPAVFAEKVDGRLPDGSALCFAHGFTVAFGAVKTGKYDVILVAPKGQGGELRRSYLAGSGLPCLLAVDSDVSGSAMETALAIAGGLGCLRTGGFQTSFREEAVSDLFGEQAVLCGGGTGLVREAGEILVERGFSPEVGYFEGVQELKIIVDLFSEKGFGGMRKMISGTAAYGGLKYGEKVIGPASVDAMRGIFDRIESGDFAREWLSPAGEGSEELEAMIEEETGLEIESAGRKVRELYRQDHRDRAD